MENNKQPEIRFEGFHEEWKVTKLGAIADSFEYGLNASAKQFDGINKYIRITDIDDVSHKFLQKGVTSPNIDLTFASNYLLQEGDILFARTGASVGKTYIYEKMDGKVYYAGFLIRARIKMGNNPIFIFQNTLTSKYDQFIKVTSQRSGQPGVNAQEYANYSLMLPIQREQDAIGVFLKKMDDIISIHQQELDMLKQTKQGFLQKMFPKYGETVPELRFPGVTGNWIESRLGNLMDVTSVKRIRQSDWTAEGVRFLRARDIVAAFKKQKINDYIYISEEIYEEYSKKSGKVSIGDLLVTGVGSIGVPMLITNNEPIYFKDGNVIWFKNNGEMNGEFLYYSFENNKIQNYIRNVAGIGTVGTYTIDSGKNTPISFPSLEEQTKIGNFFKQLDKVIALHQQELDALKQTKKAFLQKMFV